MASHVRHRPARRVGPIFELGRDGLTLIRRDGQPRLRPAQHGAALALGAHFSVNREPAIIALPTGIGKTAVMQLAPFILGSTRVLVVAPSRLLREQLVEQMTTLPVLIREGVLKLGEQRPRVLNVRHQIQTAAEWHALEAFDFVIATPSCVSPEYARVAAPPRGLFDLVVIDEAHHAAAPSWDALIRELGEARVTLFTATPYRRDAQALPGDLVYDYPMKIAVERDEIARLQLLQVDFDDVGDPDVAVIRRIRDLETDVGSGYRGVPFLARTKSIAAAKLLTKQYNDEGLEVGLVTSDHSLRHAKSVIGAFRERKILGLVVVGMLGEGFDFPEIKLAAYHRPHKSLPSTLQFFGRVSRPIPGHVGPPPLVVMPRHEVYAETQALFKDNADWSILIPSLADERIASVRRERRLHALVNTNEAGVVSDDAINPPQVVDIFELPEPHQLQLDTSRLPDDVQDAIVAEFGGDTSNFLAFVEATDQRPRWLASRTLANRSYELRVLVVCPEQQLVIVASSSSNAHSRLIAEQMGLDPVIALSPETFFGLIALHDVRVYYNVGTRNVEGDSDLRPTYMNRAGRSVGKSFTPADRESYGLGHAFFGYRTPEGLDRSFGVALGKSRIWTPERSASLQLFIEWAGDLARLVARARVAATTSVLGLRQTLAFSAFPADPVFIIPHREMFERSYYFSRVDLPSIVLGDASYRADVSSDRRFMNIGIYVDERVIGSIRYDCRGAATVHTDYQLRAPGELDTIDANEAFGMMPLAIYYGDGSATHGHLYTPRRADPELIATNVLRTPDWTEVDVRRENDVQGDPRPGLFSFMHVQLASEFRTALILNDDGRDEIADIIVIQERPSELTVRFYHCKGATGAGANLDDLYVVLGQVQRSTWWAQRNRFWPEIARRFDNRARVIQCEDRVRAAARLARWAASPPETKFEIYVVQPGIDAAQLTPASNFNTFLLVTQSLVTNYGATFGVYCSDGAPT